MTRPGITARSHSGRLRKVSTVTPGSSTSARPCACILLSALLCVAAAVPLSAQQGQGQLLVPTSPPAAADERDESPGPSEAASAGIREVIPDKYQKRYQQWKQEFLASEIGRRQWQTYAHHPHLRLTITITTAGPLSRNRTRWEAQGAEIGQFVWDEAGNLVAATISLGCQLDQGKPNSIYYPVSHSLAVLAESHAIRKPLLAAAKLAHEFGHLNHAAGLSGALFRWQNQLIQDYNAILLTNGHDTEDPRLVRLARELGRTPVEIAKEREYQGEANALLYVQERISGDDLRRALARGIKKAVEEFAKRELEPYVQAAQQQWSRPPVAVGGGGSGR